MAELYSGYPLFPGENEVDQLSRIMEVLGHPPESVVVKSSRKRLFFDLNGRARMSVNTKGQYRRIGTKPLSAAVGSQDAVFIHFISRCLQWEAHKRLTPKEALQHEFVLRYIERHNLKSSIKTHSSMGTHLSSSSSSGCSSFHPRSCNGKQKSTIVPKVELNNTKHFLS